MDRLVVLAASTGGPRALHEFLGLLPPDFPAALLVIQHMPAGFTTSFAGHLNAACQIEVREAATGDRIQPGLALVAPGGRHLVLEPSGRVRAVDSELRHGVRPAADVTLEQLPPRWAPSSHIVILTGMGMDGARGAYGLHRQGAVVWAQDEESCVVYGMPRAVAELGIVERTGPPSELAEALVKALGRPSRTRQTRR